MSYGTQAKGMENKIHSKFPKDVWDKRVEELKELGVTGAVFYTDGGQRNIKFKSRSGWGVHCYFFNAGKAEGIGGFKMDYPTTLGYKPKKEVDKDSVRNVCGISNIYGHCGTRTNQVAELEAFIQAALLYLETGLCNIFPTLSVRVDSRYVELGISNYLDTWIKNDWRKADGTTVKNLMYWKEIKRILGVINALGCTLNIEWVKGHVDYGNLIADQMATLGIFTDKEYGEEHVTIKDYNVASIAICPLMIDSKLLYYPDMINHRDGLHYYYLYSNANSQDDVNEVGRNLLDSSIAFIATEADQVQIGRYLEYCERLGEDMGAVPQVVDLNLVTKPKTVIEMEEDNIASLPRVVGKKDIKVTSTQDKVLITVLDPPRTAQFTHQRIQELYATYKQSLDGKDETIIETDITEILFEIGVNGKGVPTYKFLVSEAISVNVKVPIYKVDGNRDAAIELTFGLDLPRRRVFSNIKDVNPKISVLTWYENEYTTCYATIVRIDGAIGMWIAEQGCTINTGDFSYGKQIIE